MITKTHNFSPTVIPICICDACIIVYMTYTEKWNIMRYECKIDKIHIIYPVNFTCVRFFVRRVTMDHIEKMRGSKCANCVVLVSSLLFVRKVSWKMIFQMLIKQVFLKIPFSDLVWENSVHCRLRVHFLFHFIFSNKPINVTISLI